jgi:cyclopropane fatty-acyl-phospholipid synthase-like methyltransferase
MKYIDMDAIYRNIPPDQIPWNSLDPPGALVELVRSGTIKPCRAIDLGCGTGNYAMYLAGNGFLVTGIDGSPTAIRMARDTAEKSGLACTFIVADLLGDMHEVQETFDFAFDWEVLHHIFPEDRDAYLKNVYRLLNPGARYFSVSFSEKDPQFGGKGKFRKTRLGTVLYFSSESEISALIDPYFRILDIQTITINGKYGMHCAVSVLSERR